MTKEELANLRVGDYVTFIDRMSIVVKFEVTNIFTNKANSPKRTYWELCNDNPVQGMGFSIWDENKMLSIINVFPQKKNRPHWLLDNGQKIYPADIFMDYNRPDFKKEYLMSGYLQSNLNNLASYSPFQYQNNESDFGILMQDGSHMWARWVKE